MPAGRRRPRPLRARRPTAPRSWSTAAPRLRRARCGSCRCSDAHVERRDRARLRGRRAARRRRRDLRAVGRGARAASHARRAARPTTVDDRTFEVARRRPRPRTLRDGRRRGPAGARPGAAAASASRSTVERPDVAVRRDAGVACGSSNRTPGHGRSPGPTGRAWLRRALVAATCCSRSTAGASSRSSTRRSGRRATSRSCANEGVFPVLADPPARTRGDAGARRSSSTTTRSWRRESETAFFDALEIDELLSLRTMTLSEEEKREVRGTDPRDRGAARRGRRDAGRTCGTGCTARCATSTR